jgi:hypothetical protein
VLPFFNIGLTYETFHLLGITLVAINLLKRRDDGFTKADAQFLKMIGAGTLVDIQILQNALDLI